MNIFYLHKDPVKAAQVQYDKHVVKMILESAQMLCTAHHVYVKSKPIVEVIADVFAFGFLLPLFIVGWITLVVNLIVNGVLEGISFGIYG